MKKVVFIAAVIIMLLSGIKTKAEVSTIVNGSFEDDKKIPDITTEEPNGWDVNAPACKFGGWVWDDWQTDGSYSLTLYSYPATFDKNDIATVSQETYLYDVNQVEVLFDLKLDTESNDVWDPNNCTAVLMVDNEVIWESNSIGPDVRGEYRDRLVPVDVDDIGLHKLSLGIRINVAGELSTIHYALWDSVEFACGGSGFLDGDFDRDCYVDMNDLRILVDVWLDKVEPVYKCNLFRGDDIEPYGIINFLDFALFAGGWDGNMPDLRMFAEVWLDEVEPDNEYNLFHGDDDVEHNGVINFLDFAIFAGNWLRSSYE